MKHKRERFEAVPEDGSIRLAPGAWVSLHEDTTIKPSLFDLQAWMLRVRGEILSDVFGLENDLILLELAAEFGTLNPSEAPGTFFDRDQTLREEHSLQRKIDRAKSIIRRLREPAFANRLIQELAECRKTRNLVAHYPCWIEPVNDDVKQRTIALKLFIGDRDHIWELTEDDVKRWARLFLDARRKLIELRHELTGAPAPIFAEGSLATVPPQP